MTRFGFRILIAILAVNLAGTLPLCAMTMASLQKSTDEHACCGDKSKRAGPKDCSNCEQQNAIGFSKIVLSNLQPMAVDSFASIAIVPQTVATVDFSSVPPILVDLVHSSCKLNV